MSKKIIAFVLAIAMAFSSITVAFADEAVSAEVQALAEIGMLEGDGNGVTVEYTKKEMDRFTAAISILKLKGLYEEALAFKGEANFEDAKDLLWEDGKNILAYLKANPAIGFAGDPTTGKFMPFEKIDEQSYIKVLLETLGYKQTTAEVAGDFTWDETIEFAESIGLKATNAKPLIIDSLAKLTVSAFKSEMKNGKLLIEALIESGRVDREVAEKHGLVAVLSAALKSAKAIGNTVVEATFDGEINKAAEKVANYKIDGLQVKSATIVGEDVVRLETAAMTSGKLYTLTVGDVTVKFTGIAKVSGAPSIEKVESTDIEEVDITFDKALDYETATDVNNYEIAGVEIVKAELDGKVVTLTTNGLAARKQYTVKVTNVKSIDGVNLKSQSKSFYTRPDTTAPTVVDVKAETNKRVIVTYSEKVTKESAENIENYTIKTGSTELEILDAKLVDSGDNKEKQVELTTEAQKASARYELTVTNITDQTKAGNTMSKGVTKYFYGVKEDTTAPMLSKADVVVLSRNHIQVAFTDASKFDEATVLDANNYTVTKNDSRKAEIAVEKVEKVSFENGKYTVVLTVEDLMVNSSYVVKAENIADEFGNVLEKNNTATISVTKESIAASTVKTSNFEFVDGNTIKIAFTKPLKKESAEDIANYTIDGNIGTPIKATYKDKVVTLETITMKAGKTYKVTIKGVEDLAGNVLDLSFSFTATAGDTDTTKPELLAVYTINKYVVAAEFDEAVTFVLGTKLVLNEDIELTAKTTSMDGKVVEFSSNVALTADEYTLNKTKSFKDASGNVGIKDKAATPNELDLDSLRDFVVYGNDSEPEAPEVISIYQKDGKSFEVIMSKEVVVKKAVTNDFTVEVDEDDKTIVTFTLRQGQIVPGTNYTLNLSLVLADAHDVKAKNVDSEDETIFYSEYKDEEKPYIVNVIAKDRVTVEVEYNEAIGTYGTFEIKNTDESAPYKTITISNYKVEDNKVILTLSLPLESRYDYTLIVKSQAKDKVGNVGEDQVGDEFYFVGTDLAPVQ